ncbi:asparagine synthase-related protein [Aestuariivirga sp.]|uniref:asparagine synthase-related protein n=1 Tax=Aestuariivirga sp. TaxID=2650926 RepID=UPI0039E5DA37
MREQFWREEGREVSTASTIAELLRPGDAVDPAYIASVLLMPAADPATLDVTPYKTIHRVRAGERLVTEDRRARVERAFDWDKAIAAADAGRAEDAPRRFRAALQEAVAREAADHWGTHVSGGIDSSSVALLAAEARAVEGFALVFPDGALGGERRYADVVRSRNLRTRMIEAEGLTDFSCFKDVKPHAEPLPWLFRTGTDMALLKAAKDAGITKILTGHGADETLAAGPYEIAGFLGQGRVISAWRAAKAESEARHRGLMTALWPFGIEPLLTASATFFAGRHPRFRQPPWLRPQAARRMDWSDRAHAAAKAFHGGARPSLHAQLAANLRNAETRWIARELAEPLGITLVHPFLDPHVASLAAAIRLKHGQDPARQKPLLADAMRGLVPDEILDRPTKMPFNSLFYRGFSENRAMLLALADRMDGVALELFDPAPLKQAIEQAALGVEKLESLHMLAATLSVLKWLELLPEWHAGLTYPPRPSVFP